MATTLRKLASQVIERLSGGDQSKDSQIDERMLYEDIRQSIAQLIKIQIFERRNEGDDRMVPQSHIATYSVNIDTDTDNLEATFTLPDVPISLPYERGVTRVYPKKRPHEYLVRVPSRTVAKGLAAGYLEGKIGYALEGNKGYLLEYKDRLNEKLKKGLNVQLLVPFPTTQQADDQLPVTPDQESEIIDTVIQKYLFMPSQDRVNDGIDSAKLDTRNIRRV